MKNLVTALIKSVEFLCGTQYFAGAMRNFDGFCARTRKLALSHKSHGIMFKSLNVASFFNVVPRARAAYYPAQTTSYFNYHFEKPLRPLRHAGQRNFFVYNNIFPHQDQIPNKIRLSQKSLNWILRFHSQLTYGEFIFFTKFRRFTVSCKIDMNIT